MDNVKTIRELNEREKTIIKDALSAYSYLLTKGHKLQSSIKAIQEQDMVSRLFWASDIEPY
jgi:hypothetical protein